MPSLFDSLQLGDLKLPNRIIMAPLTRLRGTPDNLPTPIMADYYRQRASAGLILSEGTPISPQGVGYAQVPGLWSQGQVDAWKPITAAVHEAGGRIFSQIWHVGRISDPVFLGGEKPVAPSPIAASGPCLARASREALRHPARAQRRRDPRHRRRLPPRRRKRQSRRLRWRRTPRRKRLSARPVPAGWHQPPHRRVRRHARKSRPAHARGHRRRHLRLGTAPRRHAPRSARRRPRHLRQQPRGHLRATSPPSLADATSRSSQHASTSAPAASAPSSRKPSVGSTSPTRSSIATPRNR